MDIASKNISASRGQRELQTEQTMLQTALLLNGAFSGVSGFAFMMFAEPLKALMGLDMALGGSMIVASGGMLALYAFLLFALAMRPAIPGGLVKTAIVLDAGWVLGSVALIGLSLVDLSIQGKWIVGILACIVGAFAVAQWVGLARYASRPHIVANRNSSSGALRDIGRSWMGMKTWVKIWLFALNIIFILSIFFLDEGAVVAWILIAYAASGPYLFVFMASQKGLSRVLGLAHIVPWTPLLFYLCALLLTDSAIGPRVVYDENPIFHIYLTVILAATAFCLAFDYYDLVRWFKGEKYLLGSREAYEVGASKLTN